MKGRPTLPALIERFFTERLMRQRNVSPHTIASYRDTFRLLPRQKNLWATFGSGSLPSA